ncbi:hypothetical protein HDC92_002324 [Pedobacter sp. AK017]|uniref:DUF3800 domain-containing protein n=1 Tax=Pedobacter sp. AK017 TaxID=2723073 RepID=UPI0016221A86|nr:DUF3800 domain-containing protein [Pedobacter sp. AK017]MBB5438643.1 hypothetical protein [Pedobacter sp. AK017]
MKETYNLYCDESCHIENDHKKYLFLGSIKCPYNQTKLHTEAVRELKRKHNFYAEIKWTSVSKSKIHFYSDLVDYFFKTQLKFRTIAILKSKIDYQAHGKSYDDFYYTMYYYLLNHNIDTSYNYNVYLDIKDSLSARKVRKLMEILNTKYGVFRNVQNIRSHESILMQLTDFFMGAVSYLHNDKLHANEAKMQIIEKIRQRISDDLMQTNYLNNFNLFIIDFIKNAS